MRQHERESYDAAHDGEEPTPCPICTGHDAPPCSEECASIVLRAECVRLERSLEKAARRAGELADRYVVESGEVDHRVAACLRQVLVYKRAIASVRTLSESLSGSVLLAEVA